MEAQKKPVVRLLKVIPFFMSAVLFLSALFSLFAPLPLLVLDWTSRSPQRNGGASVSRGANWALYLAILTNSALVYFSGGVDILAIYTGLSTSLVVGFHLFGGNSQRTLERQFVLFWGTMVGVSLGIAGLIVIQSGLAPMEWYRQEVRTFLEGLLATVTPEAKEQMIGEIGIEEFVSRFREELPGSFLVMTFSVVFVNFLTLIRLNVGGLRESMGLAVDFFRNWRAPEGILWPTLFFAALMVLGRDQVAALGLNGFKAFMAIYAIQGFAILSSIFDLWKLKGTVRTVGFVLVFLLMSPLVLSLGFFDTWFDFRSKFRQA